MSDDSIPLESLDDSKALVRMNVVYRAFSGADPLEGEYRIQDGIGFVVYVADGGRKGRRVEKGGTLEANGANYRVDWDNPLGNQGSARETRPAKPKAPKTNAGKAPRIAEGIDPSKTPTPTRPRRYRR